VHDLVAEGTRVRFDVDSDRLDDAMGLLLSGGLRSLTSQPPTLEELFLRHYNADADQRPASTRSRAADEAGAATTALRS
jgi:ABC-2 type transport system ATP-binding protein